MSTTTTSGAPAATTSAASDPGQSPAAKAAAIAVPIVFMGTLIIALTIFFYMIRRQRRREDEEREVANPFRDSSPSPMLEKKETSYTGPAKPRNSSQIDPRSPVQRRKSSQIETRNPVTPPNNQTFLSDMSSRRGNSRGDSSLIIPGRMNSEPFARDQGPLVKNAIRDSGLISPGTEPMPEYFPARHHADNFSIPSERSDEEDEESFGKLGALSRVSYVDSERDIEYGAGQPTTVAHVERPAPVVATRNLSTNGYTYQGYGQHAHGSSKMRTL